MSEHSREVVVVDSEGGPELPLVLGHGRAWATVWPGMGARLRSMHRISLGPRARTVEMTHVSDAVYYVISGHGETLDREAGTTHPLVTGSMFHVDAGTPYQVLAGEEGIELVGGPSPPDPSLYPVAVEPRER